MPAACSARTISLNCAHLVARLVAVHVAAVRREEGHRVVAPVVRRGRASCRRMSFDRELVHRHQLDGRHAERLQVRNLLDDAEVRAGMLRRRSTGCA